MRTVMTLEDERLQFFSHLGKALDEWTQVENHLCFIFMVTLRAPHLRAAAAFYAVENFRSKLGMVHAVVRLAKLNAAKMAEWEALRKRIDNKSRARNELAHYQVLEDPDAKPGKRLALRPALLDPHSPSVFQADGPRVLHLKELRERQAAFRKLADDAGRLYRDLCKLLGMPPNSP